MNTPISFVLSGSSCSFALIPSAPSDRPRPVRWRNSSTRVRTAPFSAREYALRKLRDGYETLSVLKRGRPDLEFLKTTPGAILISTIFARSTWRYGLRGYRNALRDAGQLMENFAITGNALGIQTMTRMRLTESTSRELIGVALRVAGLDSAFRATASSDEVSHGKPAPDVYLLAAQRHPLGLAE